MTTTYGIYLNDHTAIEPSANTWPEPPGSVPLPPDIPEPPQPQDAPPPLENPIPVREPPTTLPPQASGLANS